MDLTSSQVVSTPFESGHLTEERNTTLVPSSTSSRCRQRRIPDETGGVRNMTSTIGVATSGWLGFDEAQATGP